MSQIRTETGLTLIITEERKEDTEFIETRSVLPSFADKIIVITEKFKERSKHKILGNVVLLRVT